jgi:DNA-directed RNA polymerase subunit beta
MPFAPDRWRGIKPTVDLIDATPRRSSSRLAPRLPARLARKLAEEGLKDLLVADEDLYGMFIADDTGRCSTGEIHAEAGSEIDEKLLEAVKEAGYKEFACSISTTSIPVPYIRNTLMARQGREPREALVDIYRVMRPGEPPTRETAERCSMACSSTRSATICRGWPREDEHAPRP